MACSSASSFPPSMKNCNNRPSYQASSPDEIALVKYAEACGVQLVPIPNYINKNQLHFFNSGASRRSEHDCACLCRPSIHSPQPLIWHQVCVCGSNRTFHILAVFPFSSETKRMGIGTFPACKTKPQNHNFIQIKNIHPYLYTKHKLSPNFYSSPALLL